MLINLIFLCIISAGSIFGAVLYRRKYEEILPLTTMGIVLTLFVFGIFGALKLGFYAVLTATAFLYVFSCIHLIRNRNIREVLSALITPGSMLFLATFTVLSILNYGMLASAWDEFSHWVDITKVMTILDDFGTNPLSQSAYMTYPPAMALFQWFLQKLVFLFSPNAGFEEWRVYFAYQIFFISILMPFFKGMSFKVPLHVILLALALFASPLLFYSNIYSAVYIDAFLGILSGAGLAMIFLSNVKNGTYSMYILMVCAVLVLSKDVGLFLGIMLAAAYVLDTVFTPSDNGKWYQLKRNIILPIMAVLSVALPKLLWNLELITSGADAQRSSGIDFSAVFEFLLGRGPAYRTTVIKNFVLALFDKTITIGNTGIKMNYFALILTELFLLVLAYKLFVFTNSEAGRGRKATIIIAIGQPVIYTAGLCFIYAFKFSQYEALNLASYERYMNVALLAAWLMALLILIPCVLKVFKNSTLCCSAVIYILLLVTPMKPLVQFAGGAYINNAAGIRSTYQPLVTKIMDAADSDSNVYFISQETTGFDYWVVRYSIRPNEMNDVFTWSIGEPFYEGNIWTASVSPEDWKDILIANYDYVALYKINDYFLENYSAVFEDPDSIRDNTLFKVNKETGLLEFCE